LCEGCNLPFKRIQTHLHHNLACNGVYAARQSLIDPFAAVGGTVIDSAAKAAQYHASLSSLLVTGVSTGRESRCRSRQRFPAPFEFGARDAGTAAASAEVAVDETSDDDANVFGEDEYVVPPPLPAQPDPLVNGMTDPDEGVLELYEELLRLESNPFSSVAKFSCGEGSYRVAKTPERLEGATFCISVHTELGRKCKRKWSRFSSRLPAIT
jgi:hypothetical protein